MTTSEREKIPAAEGPPELDRKHLLLAWVVPALALLAVACLPLIAGERTLYLRDVFGTHLEMKWFQAEAMAEGRVPLVDPYRSGGQAHLGNPNTVPLYPTNLLYLVAPFFWSFNAHFWLHLLIAPISFYALARAWRLEREAAWMGGVAFAASGYFLSTLNLFNLVAPVALAPGLVAATLALADAPRRGRLIVAVGFLWALVLLGGDPMTAAMALVLAVSAVAVRAGRRWSAWGSVAASLALGTLVALPQLVEFARIVRHSFRGAWGYSAATAAVASFSPTAAFEWLLPLFFGWPNLGYWGRAAYGGDMPLLFSLAPGALVLSLVLASGRPFRHASWWAWAAVGLGLFLSLGANNPLFGLLMKVPGLGVIRLPIKFWLLVAVGGSLLAALGFERLVFAKRRALGRALAALATVYAGLWVFFSFGGSVSLAWARRRIPEAFGDPYVAQERLRWAGVALVSLLVVLAALAVLRLARGHPRLLALLPVLHLVTQLFLLKPLLATEEIAPYLARPPLLEAIPEGSSVVHGDRGGLFGARAMPLDRYPDLRLIWLSRQTHRELFPQAGQRFGVRYEFDHSPEGLDAFLTRAAAQAVGLLPDPARIKLLAASGVDRLITSRRLELLESAGQVELVAAGESLGGGIYVYGIPSRVDRARWTDSIVRAPHLNATLETLTAPSFDARRATVLPGALETPPSPGNPLGLETVPGPAAGVSEQAPSKSDATVRWIEDSAEEMVLEVNAPRAGALVVQRTPLSILRAEVDGREAPIQPADLHRIGVELEAGAHQVRIWADRGPLRLSSGLAVLAVVVLPLFAWRRSRPQAAERSSG